MPEMRLKLMTAIIAFALTVGVGVASATVVIYNNNFKGRAGFQALKKFDAGKACKKSHRGKKSFGVKVTKGPLQCDFRTPVSGDSKEPDHEIEAKATVVKKSTAKSVRKDSYVGVALRADKSSRYELRVFPHTQTWQVRRRPDRGDFPLTGTDPGIAGLGKSNKLKLRVFGDKINAFVNKTKLVDEFKDPNPGQLNGRKTMILAGHGKKGKKDANAFFKNVRIRVP